MSSTAVLRLTAVLLAVLLPLTGEAQTLFGTVTDSETGEPIQDAVVSAASPSLHSERTVVTDAEGRYRLPSLPPGGYYLLIGKETYKLHEQLDLVLLAGHSLRVDVRLVQLELGEAHFGPSLPPVIDLGSTSTGAEVVEPERPSKLATSWPSGRDGAVRTASHLAQWVPGVTDGLSLHGASPYENAYRVDGFSTRDAISGLDALPVSPELLSRFEVLTGGYQPEHGGATGGVLLTEWKHGGNALHGSVFAHWAPGVLEGRRRPVPEHQGALGNQGDFGATLGGAVVKDRAWFFAGVIPSLGREAHTGQRSLQALGRVTYRYAMDHHVSMSVLTAPGSFRVAGAGRDSQGTHVTLHQSSAFLTRQLLLDVRAGWLGQRVSQQPVDGSDALGALLEEGGPVALPERAVDRYQGSVRATWLRSGPEGSHTARAGVELERFVYDRTLEGSPARTTSTVLAGHLQESWMPSRQVTVNAGLRYDVQRLDADGSGRAPVTSSRLSPRVGLIVDPVGNGRLKLFVQYGRQAGGVPLGLLDGVAWGDGTPARRAAVVDPDLELPASRELGVGVESGPWRETRVAATYTRRTLESGLASIPEAGGDGVRVVNPGSGLAADLPRAERTYDVVTLAATRSFQEHWLGHVSYTASRLRGNHAGPWAAPARDTASGPLPEDRPHVARAYGARQLRLTRTLTFTPGLAYLGSAGTPVEGAATRTPWVHSLDLHLELEWRLRKRKPVSFSLDAFNVLNLQAATRLEERATALVPVRYQLPRQVRLGVRHAF